MSKITKSIQSSLNDIADGLLGSSQDEVDSKKIDEEKAENEVNQLNEKEINLLSALNLAAEKDITNDIPSNENSGPVASKDDMGR